LNKPQRPPNRQWLLPLEYENEIVLNENVRAEAIRALTDLLLEAADQLSGGGAKKGTSDEPKDQN
jgi:hypothetical protein